MTDTHREFALNHIRRVVAIASAPNPPITMAEAVEQILETLDIAGLAPMDPAGAEAFEPSPDPRLH